jgi:PHD/YefM family antitoxin component YafN of YafNO toxin-antitoxin module
MAFTQTKNMNKKSLRVGIWHYVAMISIERRDEVVSITQNGKPVVMIVSKDEYQSWQEKLEIITDANFMREIRTGIQSLKRTKKHYTLDELFAR